jgi:hypothetical protein
MLEFLARQTTQLLITLSIEQHVLDTNVGKQQSKDAIDVLSTLALKK